MQQGGKGLASGRMCGDAAQGALGVEASMQAGGPEDRIGCGPRVSWREGPAATCEGAAGQGREAERVTDTDCVSHGSTIVGAAEADTEGDAAGRSLAVARQAGRLEADGPGEMARAPFERKQGGGRGH